MAEGVAVMFLYQLGEFLQAVAVGSSRRSIVGLLELKADKAFLMTEQGPMETDAKTLKTGDVIFVRAGDKIPADCTLISQTALVDTKSLTGEPKPKLFKKGDELFSGYVASGAAFEACVLRPCGESAAARVLELVESAAAKKAEPEKFISKFARYYTPIVCVLAVLIAALAPLIHSLAAGGSYSSHAARWVQTALSFLVISCPCALVISVPLAYFGGIGACAKSGALVKGSVYLDVAARAKMVALDKTGTLTRGDFSVLGVHPERGITAMQLLTAAASAERGSSHPLARAFKDISAPMPESAQDVLGKGVKATLAGSAILVGSAAFLTESGVPAAEKQTPHSALYVAKDGAFLGYIEVGDALKPQAKESIVSLKALGLKTVMLTGDDETRAKTVASELGLDGAYGNLMPEDKLTLAQTLCKDGLIYVGDGINDAPVMAAADCAVSMGKLGSGAAVETSDVVLVSDDLSALVSALKIARKTRKIVLENVAFSIAVKIAFMVLGLFGLMPLGLAVFGDVGVMLLAVVNSMRIRAKRK
jgi:Cd2+/Zn2+-exporting ATPase